MLIDDWERFRRDDHSIDLLAAYVTAVVHRRRNSGQVNVTFADIEVPAQVEKYFSLIDLLHPVRSRQAAAIAVAQALMFAEDTQ